MNRYEDILVNLTACLIAQIEEDAGDDPKPCGIRMVPGSQAVSDYWTECDGKTDGEAWVRLANAYPAVAPGVVNEAADNCNTTLGIEIEVGMVRSMPASPEGYTPAEHAEFVRLQMKDLVTMRKAIVCCSAIFGKDAVLSSYTPIGPTGLEYGGQWLVMAHVV